MPSDEHYARLRNRADAAVADGSADAPRLAADAVAWCRRHLAADDPELAWALVRQAQTVPDQVVETGGRVTYRFVLLFEEALGILRKAHGPRSEPVADALASFAGLLSPRDPVAAVAPLRERLTVLRSLRGPAPPDVGAAACVLAQALSHAAQTLRNEAAAQYRASLDVWARQPASPWTAAAWSGWGELAAGAGDLDTADHAYRQAVEVARNLASGPDPALARHLPALAGIAVRRGRPDEAVPLWEEALSVQRAVSGDADPGVAATWFSLSLATAGARSLEASREALRAAGAWLETGAAADLDDRRRLAVLADPLRYADRHLAQLAALGSDAAEAVEAAAWRRRLPDLVSRPWRLSPARHPDERDLGAVLSEIATRHQERYQTARTDRGADASGRRFIGHAASAAAARQARGTGGAAAPRGRGRPGGAAAGVRDARRGARDARRRRTVRRHPPGGRGVRRDRRRARVPSRPGWSGWGTRPSSIRPRCWRGRRWRARAGRRRSGTSPCRRVCRPVRMLRTCWRGWSSSRCCPTWTAAEECGSPWTGRCCTYRSACSPPVPRRCSPPAPSTT